MTLFISPFFNKSFVKQNIELAWPYFQIFKLRKKILSNNLTFLTYIKRRKM
jgi:hypothetical protein